MRLQGKVVSMTGAASRMRRAIATRFAAARAQVKRIRDDVAAHVEASP